MYDSINTTKQYSAPERGYNMDYNKTALYKGHRVDLLYIPTHDLTVIYDPVSDGDCPRGVIAWAFGDPDMILEDWSDENVDQWLIKDSWSEKWTAGRLPGRMF